MRVVTTIPIGKFKDFAFKIVQELSGNYSENKIDMVDRLNRKLAGWSNFYMFTDFTAIIYSKLDRIIFWKLARWVRHPEDGKAKSWKLFGRNGKGNLCGVVLRRLVTSRKAQFRWRNPEINPYIQRDEVRNTVTSRYHDIAMALSHT